MLIEEILKAFEDKLEDHQKTARIGIQDKVNKILNSIAIKDMKIKIEKIM